ncbi:ArgE/DapE family deacylase [Candidatus Bathyarchaeota archaeon]|nr:ArgE/DapE family deacylase [Candidatus Bathyarchaeota archaeon]
MSVEEVLSKVESARRELAEVCSQLVQRPSQHPEGRTEECVAYIKDYFDELGIPTEIYERKEGKPNIVARIRGTTERRIMWIGHLDVVPEGKPENWTYPPYSGKITEDGFIWGRGASDCKGACAAAMVAARVLNELKEVPNSVDFWFTADEEIGGLDGARWLAEEKIFEGEVCIVGDGSPGPLDAPSIDLGCKGGAGTRLIARGKTAHGSTPFLGENAIEKLIKVIPYVKRIAEFRLELPEELEPVIESTIQYMLRKEGLTPEQREAVKRLFHYPSVSLNILNGGVKSNVVPDYAEAYFDIRLTPGSNPLRVRERILELVKEAGVPGVTAEVRASPTAGYYESPETPFARQLAETVERVTGRRPIFKILTGGTDAISIKRFLGIPCLGFGAGMDEQAHAPDEHNSIENIMRSCKVYAAFPLIYRG